MCRDMGCDMRMPNGTPSRFTSKYGRRTSDTERRDELADRPGGNEWDGGEKSLPEASSPHHSVVDDFGAVSSGFSN